MYFVVFQSPKTHVSTNLVSRTKSVPAWGNGTLNRSHYYRETRQGGLI